MKKIFILSLLCAIASILKAQNTYPFPSSGNVGIGTLDPNSNLHIFESSESKPGGTVSPTKSVLKFSRSGSPYYAYTESAEFRIGHGGPNVWGSQLDLFINSGTNQSNIPDQHVMTWLYNGNVGIGTTNPNVKLLATTNNSNNAVFSQVTGTSGNALFGLDVAGVASTILTTYRSDQTFRINHFGIDAMSINSSGNVGIGTIDDASWQLANSTYKLAVGGNIIATAVTVKLRSAWPDYVFKPTYKLPTLSEVKTYIDLNHHLPDMPSEKDVAGKGLDLGEMNKLLTKKVEELTLYLIQDDKVLKEERSNYMDQQKDILNMKKQLDGLNKKLETLIKK